MRTVFGWPLYSDVGVAYTPTLSNGTWSSSLPLTNLQNRFLSKVARSTAATTASTKLDCDLGVARAIGVVAVVKHNFSTAAQWRVRGASDSGFTSIVYDSGTIAAWPSGITAEDVASMAMSCWVCPSSAQTARYWRVEITDTANAAGYVQFGRLVIAGGYEPSYRPHVSSVVGFDDSSSRAVTDGGKTALYDVRAIRRSAKVGFDTLPEAEAFASAWLMQRQLSTSGQLFFIWDADETVYPHEHAFLGVLQTLTPLSWVEAAYLNSAYEVQEEL